jgi:phage tail sheath protein FI
MAYNFSSLLYPQASVAENAAASRIIPVASHVHIYLIGATESGDANVPTIVSSYADFTNAFGSPLGTETVTTGDAVRLIFENNPKAQLYFIKAGAGNQPNGTSYVTAVDAIEIEANLPAGFLIAPSAFKHLYDEADRISVGNKLVSKAEEQDHIAILDCPDSLSDDSYLTSDVVDDKAGYSLSTTGHSIYIFPYVVETLSTNERTVPSSCVKAAITTLRYRESGIAPGAGLKFPIKGVSGGEVAVTAAEQGVLEPAGIQVVRKVFNQGTLIWSARTTSAAVLYQFEHYRAIANVVNRSFRQAMDLKLQLFELIDGEGELLATLEETANSVGAQLYNRGYLFGASEQDAFQAKCDFENNTDEELQQGNVLVEFVYSIAPHVNKLAAITRVTNIGDVQQNITSGEQTL